MKFNNVKTIFFDYDGTLHNSMEIYAPAFRKSYSNLVSMGLAKDKDWNDEEILKWIGYSPDEMWEKFMPDLDEEIKVLSSNIISEEMNRLIKTGAPKLYDRSIETLDYLKNKGYNLIFISNCKREYMENHRDLFNLDLYFNDMICSEDYNYLAKKDILRKHVHKYPKEMVIVGDRDKDIEAGKFNSIMTIGCAYGYGKREEIDKSDKVIEDISELMNIF
jgi:phosphoglycolate phosphatase